jgi:NADH:ubiquinone oxidoreductase subunit 6 (subunit J)
MEHDAPNSAQLDAYKAEARELIKLGIETSQRLGARLSSWIVLGNVGGLVLTFNAIVQGATCDVAVLRRAGIGFAAGAGLAGAAVVVSYVNNLMNAFAASRLMVDLQRRRAPRSRQTAHWALAILSWLLLAASLAVMSVTVLTPLLGGGAAIQACSAKGRSAATSLSQASSK